MNVVLSTGFGSTSLTNHTRGSATADTVLRSLTPFGVGKLFSIIWNNDHGVVKLFNNPRCNLGDGSGYGNNNPMRG